MNEELNTIEEPEADAIPSEGAETDTEIDDSEATVKESDEDESDLTAEDLYDDKLTQLGEMIQGASYMVGVNSGKNDGFKEAIGILNKEAAKWFTAREDDKADMYRKASDMLQAARLALKEEKQTTYWLPYYKNLEDMAFTELERRDKENEVPE